MPGTPVVLDSLGGLVSTARPESLPEGASPRNWDCDFTVGRFFQRPGERNVYSYEGVSFGPNGGGAASGAGINPWANPTNILAEDGAFTDSTVGASGASSVVSTGASGSNSGTGQPWTNPGNIASLSAYASVVLGGSGTFAFSPNNTNTSVTQTGPGSSSNTSSIITCAAAAAGGTATVSGDITASITATLGGGSVTAYYMSDLQPTWTPIVGESTTVGPVPFSSVVNVSNLSTLQLKVVTMASAGGGGSCSVSGSITNCQAVISGTGILNSQTLVANLAGLSIPAGAAIVGVNLSFSGLYSGTLPTLSVALSVGTESDAVTLGTSAGSHSLGSSTDLWGYGSWTAATLSSLAVKFNVSTAGSTSAFLNSLVVTVWYSYAGSGTTAKLLVTQFNFTLPSTASITGIVVNVKGYAPDAELFAQLLKNGVAVGGVKSVSLPASNAYASPLGSETDVWDETWTYSDIDAVGFGVSLWATSASTETIALDYADIEVFGTEGSTNYTGLMSAYIDSQDLTTLALDAMGLVWEEDVSNNPNVLVRAGLIPPVVPGSYMKGVDANGVAFMAYSDLTQGTSQPMQYNGQWCDRITQVGPGSAPVFTPVQSSTDSFDISTITQPAQQVRGSSYFLQSAGPGNTTAGSNVTVYYSDSTLAGPDTLLQTAFNSGNAVYLYMQFAGSGIPTQGPYVVQVTSIGLAQPPGQPRSFYYFTYTLPTSAYQYFQGSTSSSYTVTYQQSLATMTTTAPVPGLAVGSQIVVTGVTPSSWNNTWTITESLNSGSVSINQTSVAGGVATYDYTLISGVAPSAGQLVTITGTLNDGGTLNGANLVIATATGGSSGSFTVNVSQANAAAVAETGQATTAGTQFTFDPGTADVGTSTNPIFGNGTGGALTFSAAPETLVTAGTKQGSVFWITRNGAVSRPAFPVTFTVPSNTQSIAATLIPIGPANVIARGITFTESGQNGVAGASFYTYDSPVKYSVNGLQYIASALIIPDNVTTSASFSFPDSVLLASDEIDIEGNNYFNLIELGSPTWMFQYATRMLYGLCQTKVQNFVNLTFDGGYNPATFPQPLGWTPIPPATDIQAGLVPSADFGTSLQILNTGGTATPQILYYQSAYQDGYGVNILQPNTAYSVRLKGRSLSANAQVVSIGAIPFATGAFGDPVGVAEFTLNQGAFTIQTAALIPSLAVIPPTLQLAIEMGALAAGAGIQIDRIEVFPTERPVDTTTIWTSYAGNFEAVDIVTGQLGCGGDNPQATQGAYQILENLYIEKLNSRCVTQDSPNYEPDQWKVALCAQGVGSPGPNAFHSEEEFSISASRSGISLFDGGKPMPIARELQASGVNGSIWETINWNAGKTIWCRFSTTERKLYVGVPMITPNFWLPNDPASTPASPNIVLMCNFTGCPTAEELVSGVPVHTTMFGDLKALDMRRKWSPWHMPCPAAEFITRQDGLTAPLFLCNGIDSSKIYELVPGAASGGQNTDDGVAISWLYVTSPWVKAAAGQQNPALGALRKIWFYLTATMEGIGQVAGKIYSNSLGATTQNTFTIPLPFTLSYPQQNDQERVLEIGGQRVFVEFSAIGSGGYAEVGTITLDGEMDKNAPHRGVAS